MVVPPYHKGRNQNQENKKDYWQHVVLVLSVDKKLGQSDSNFEGVCSVGVAELETVLLLLFIGETFV